MAVNLSDKMIYTYMGALKPNLAYFEQLAGIYDPAEQQVGLCFVELLPGVYNEKVSPALLFKKVG